MRWVRLRIELLTDMQNPAILCHAFEDEDEYERKTDGRRREHAKQGYQPNGNDECT